MPQPLSTMRMSLRPPPSTSMRMRVAPASSAFSSSSLTTDAGRSTTSPAAIWLATWSVSTRMRPMDRWYGRVRVFFYDPPNCAVVFDRFNDQGEGTRMASFYRATVGSFLAATDEELLAQLSIEYAQ